MHIHANSSLPRSGSELLQALIGQHPDVYASATSPLLEFWFGAQTNFNLSEVKSQPKTLMVNAFQGFLKNSAEGWYKELTSRPTVVDKSRGWLEYAELLWRVYPDARIICMVRSIDKIIESLEKIYRKHPGHPETRHLPKTAQKRAEYWVQSGSKPLGLALERIRDRRSRGPDARILYVEYRDLTHDPVGIMREVYKHIDVTPFDINPNKIEKSAEEDDSYYGIFGNHKILPQVIPSY
jgi:sulfotransferase